MSFRERIEARLPTRESLSQHPVLGAFAHRLHEPHLWHFGRRTVARSVGYGLCVSFFPIPIHMLLVLPIALLRRLNLAVLVAAVWVSNPVTIVPMFYFAYRVGLVFTGPTAGTMDTEHFSLDWATLATTLQDIWPPLFLGCALCGLACGVVARWVVDAFWRAAIRRRWQQRRAELPR